MRKNDPGEQRFAIVGALIYAVGVIALSCFHEVWRDEVVPMTMAAQSASLRDAIAAMHNYGHPALWVSLLYAAYQIIPHFFVLKIVNLAISIAAVYVFLSRAPFSRFQKALFTLGIFPLYIYPVISRNYGISMLLIFLFCVLYPMRFTRFVMIGGVLFLLANAHVHSLITVMAILASLVFEFIFSKESRRKWLSRPWDTLVGFVMIVLGIVISIAEMTPDQTSLYERPPVSAANVLNAFVRALVLPGQPFVDLFFDNGLIFASLLIWALLIYFLNNMRIFVMFAGATLGLIMFNHLIFYTLSMRHQGAFFLVFMLAMWLDRVSPEPGLAPRWRWIEAVRSSIGEYKNALFTFILILQMCLAVPAIKKDILRPYSSSRELALFIKKDPSLKDAIVMAEAGGMAEPLPYYIDNRIYLPREERFGRYCQITTSNKLDFSLDDFLAIGRKLKAVTGSPIVMVMEYPLSPEGPFFFKGYHGKSFRYSKESLETFLSVTIRLTSFRDAIRDENYDVYLLK